MSTDITIPDDRVDAKAIAKKYGLDESTVLKRAKKGLIPCIRIGKSVRFDLAAVIAAIEGPQTIVAKIAHHEAEIQRLSKVL